MPRKKLVISEDQARLPFGGSRAAVAAHSLSRTILTSLVGSLCVVGGLYVGLVMLSVFHAVRSQEMVTENQKIAAEVSNLEQEYLSRSTEMTETYAHTLGLVAPTSRTFIERGALTLSQPTSNAR